MQSRVGVAPGTLTITLDGAGNFGLIDPYSRHVTSRYPYEGYPTRSMFEIMPNGRVVPNSAPFMSPTSWKGGEPFRSIVMSTAKGPLAGAFSAPGDFDDMAYGKAKLGLAVVVAAGLGGIAGGIGGAAIGAGKGNRGNAAGGAAIGSLLGPVGTTVGAAIGAGKGNRLRAGGGALVGAIVGSLALGFATWAVVG